MMHNLVQLLAEIVSDTGTFLSQDFSLFSYVSGKSPQSVSNVRESNLGHLPRALEFSRNAQSWPN